MGCFFVLFYSPRLSIIIAKRYSAKRNPTRWRTRLNQLRMILLVTTGLKLLSLKWLWLFSFPSQPRSVTQLLCMLLTRYPGFVMTPTCSYLIWHWLTSPWGRSICHSRLPTCAQEFGISAKCGVRWLDQFSSFLSYASIFTMGLIAFNRYIRIIKRTLYRKLFPSKRATRIYCALIWLFSILLDIPLLTGWVRSSYDEKLNHCKLMSYAYPTFIGAVFTNGVMIAIFYCYYKIYKAVKESTDNLNAHAEGNGVHSSNDSRRSNIPDVKVLKACFTVACFFVITWYFLDVLG